MFRGPASREGERHRQKEWDIKGHNFQPHQLYCFHSVNINSERPRGKDSKLPTNNGSDPIDRTVPVYVSVCMCMCAHFVLVRIILMLSMLLLFCFCF